MRGVFARVAALLVLVAGCEASVCADGLCFAEGRRTSWGVVPEVMRWVDVDGDGLSDLVAVSPGQGTVTIAWGANATIGGFANSWSVAEELAGLAVVDVDRDGRLDVVTTAPRSDEVVVLRGLGERGFEKGWRVIVGDEPRAVISDGMGLVTMNAGDGTVSVVRGDVVASVVVGPEPRDVAAADLDGDGDVDLAVAVAGRGVVQLLNGDGEGGYSVGEIINVGAAPLAVVVADFDGDGAVDLATADALGNTVSVALGDGARRVWAVDPEPRALAVVERAGKVPGLAVLSSGTGSVQVLEPATGERVAGVTGREVVGLAAGDVDGTPGTEVVVADGGGISMVRPGVGVVTEVLWTGALVEQRAFAVDVDGDGIDEVLVVRTLGEQPEAVETTAIEVMRGGVVDEVIEVRLAGAVGAVFDGDFTGDGRLDLFLRTAEEAVVLVGQEEGWVVGEVYGLDGVTALASASTPDRRVMLIGREGVLSELRADVAGTLRDIYQWDIKGSPRWVSWEDGFLVYAEESSIRVPLSGTQVDLGAVVTNVVRGDFAGDGATDLAVCADDELVIVADVYAEHVVTRLGADGCGELAVSDVNGDGVEDLLVMRREPGYLVVTPWLMVSGVWTKWASRSLPGRGSGRFARLDGDGIFDVLTNAGGMPMTAWGVTWGSGLYEMELRRFGTTGAVIGDVNGDGAADAVLYGQSLAVGFGDGDGGVAGPFNNWSREQVLSAAMSRPVLKF